MRHTLLFLWIFLGFGCSGCKKRSPSSSSPSSLQALVLLLPFQFSDAGQRLLLQARMSQYQLQKQLEQTLRQSKDIQLFGAKHRSPHSYALELDIQTEGRAAPRNSAGKRRYRHAIISVSARITPLQSNAETIVVKEQVDLQMPLHMPPPIESIQHAINLGHQRLGVSVRTFAHLRRASNQALLRALRNPNSTTQRHAAFLSGRRRILEAVPSLIRLLRSPEESTVLYALSALVQLKDPRAAIPLIQAATHRNDIFTTQVISALSEIGGEHAQGYLFTLSTAHPNREIQQSAREALQEIEQRQKHKPIPSASTTSPPPKTPG